MKGKRVKIHVKSSEFSTELKEGKVTNEIQPRSKYDRVLYEITLYDGTVCFRYHSELRKP